MLRLQSRETEAVMEMGPHPHLGARESLSQKATFTMRPDGGVGAAGCRGECSGDSE